MRRRDPAGIVFCSQYFVLFHELLEDWFTSASPTPIAKDGRALPIPPNLRNRQRAPRGRTLMRDRSILDMSCSTDFHADAMIWLSKCLI